MTKSAQDQRAQSSEEPGSDKTGSDKTGNDETGFENLSYEQARDELVRVVNQLEQGSNTLEESLTLWERGEALARRCEDWLIGAKARLDAARAGHVAAASGEDTGK